MLKKPVNLIHLEKEHPGRNDESNWIITSIMNESGTEKEGGKIGYSRLRSLIGDRRCKVRFSAGECGGNRVFKSKLVVAFIQHILRGLSLRPVTCYTQQF